MCRGEADVTAWIARGAELFDLRKTGTFRYDEIEKIAMSALKKAWEACNSASIRVALEKCLTLSNPLRRGAALRRSRR
jgi:hypothetical protein